MMGMIRHIHVFVSIYGHVKGPHELTFSSTVRSPFGYELSIGCEFFYSVFRTSNMSNEFIAFTDQEVFLIVNCNTIWPKQLFVSVSCFTPFRDEFAI